ncbi:MAG TPA: lysophospholipid acyltransferase family protein [Pyrinomonadaceae bacterium]|nr:lysophospholipid acyltransferase family protein [Pyrinomonadaceae bacterium]
MSETSAKAAPQRPKNGAQGEPAVLPSWFIDLVRPVGQGLSRLLWKIRYRGLENVPQSGGLIIASNHQTYIDPFWIGFPISRPLRFLAWSEIFDWPVVGKLSQLFGAWPLEIERSDPTAIRRSLQWLRDGGAIVIFPEGEREFSDGHLRKFKPGAARLALETGVPILPVTIRGGNRVWPRGKSFPRFARVEIIYHPPIQLTHQDNEETRHDARRETQRLADIIKGVNSE